jgi:hypothetical protein
MTRRSKGTVIVAAAAGAVVAAQAAVIVRLLLDRGRSQEERSDLPRAAPSVLPPADIAAAVPPQDPHSPPTGPIKTSHRPPGGVPQAPDTDATSGSVGDASGETPGESTRAGERSLS